MINMIQKAYAYTLLQPLPGIGGGAAGPGLADYLSWLFRCMLVAAAFLAIIQIVIGGIQMIIGGASETSRTSAKSRIQDAIYGLLLALASWLILWTINPDLAQMKLTIPEITIKVTAPSTPPSTACGGNILGVCPSGQQCDLVSGVAPGPTARYACRSVGSGGYTCGGEPPNSKLGTCPQGKYCDVITICPGVCPPEIARYGCR